MVSVERAEMKLLRAVDEIRSENELGNEFSGERCFTTARCEKSHVMGSSSP